MSEARNATMGKIKASIDGHEFDLNTDALKQVAEEEIQLDEAAAVVSNKDLIQAQLLKQAELKTEADIQRLEEAKRKATSQTAKDAFDAEIRQAKAARAQKEEEEREAAKNPPDVPSILKARTGAAISKGKSTVDRAMGVAREGWGGLSRVTTPGTIFLPVAVLFIFFFLLLPVNGNTRAAWLWLALTGNAKIGFLEQLPQAQVNTVPAGQASSQALNEVIATQGNNEQPARFTGVQEP